MALASLRVLLLLALWSVQRSLGDITEIELHHEPDDYVELTFRDDGPLDTFHQMSRRQTGGQPHVDGEHQFHDGYHRGRIHYSGDDSDVIVVLTYDVDGNDVAYHSNLYRSTDYGSSFTNINGKVNNATLYQFYRARGDVLIFVHATEPKLSYSLNEGASFTTVTLDPSTLDPVSVKYHPTRNDWMMMQDEDNSLYVTTDYGAHWTRVAGNVDFYQWGDAVWDDDRTIYLTKLDSTNTDISLNLYTSVYPYDRVTVFDRNLGNHDGFLVVGRYIFAQRTDDGVIGLYVSDKRGPFKKAQIPTPEAHKSYLVATINEAQALVIIEHEGDFYNLYLSDDSGIFYSLSLRDLVIEEDPLQIDLELIDGLNGTLIANQYTREDVSQSGSSIRTLITLDNGGFWQGLLPPERGVDGSELNCEPPSCYLHLHMDTTEYARLGVYSTDSAPGIIIAHGNTGEELSDNPDLYISRDGGVMWVEILAGSWGVNVADHGGLMVAAKDYHQEQSRVLKYSCNEGQDWFDFEFIAFNFTVFGVITEPGQHTTIVSLYGGPWGGGTRFEWTVVTVDFLNVFLRDCVDSDYYDWRPWDLRSETSCILGSSITIERRLPNVCCKNGRNYDREFDYSICQCTIEDYECDYGYARPSLDLNAPCARDVNVLLPDPCADGKSETYMASTGYRKIAGDVCVDGEEYLFQPFEAPCCGNTTQPPTPYHPHTTDSSSGTTQQPTSSGGGGNHTQPPTSSGGGSDHTQSPTTQPPTSSGGDDNHTGSPAPATKSETYPTVAVTALGVLLGLAFVVAAAFMVACIFFFVKYKSMREKYIHIMTAGEPALQSYTVSAEQELPSAEDEGDDKPLVL